MPNHLPLDDGTRFVGRSEELEELAGYVDAGRRLVTVLGPPGTGKTRLLRELARHLRDLEVYWCELASTRTREDVLSTVAAAVGCKLVPGNEFEENVRHVGEALMAVGPSLLLLDNFEQVSAFAAETVGAWFGQCPETHFIASSRHRLELGPEYVFDLEPLGPQDAVELFTDRARMVKRDFEADPEAVGELVERLDRLPLAIELAAARVATLPPAELLRRLDARFELLRSRKRGISPRQATLEAAIEWSWDLLDDDERSALCQCALFRGGFDLEAAEAIVEVGGDTLDVIESLRAKSLLTSSDGRLALYESVREFAGARLDDVDAVQRHAQHYAARGRELASRMHGKGGYAFMQALERESANLVAAFERTQAIDLELALALAASLDDLLRFVGPSEMHEELLEEALALAPAAGDPDVGLRFRRARAELEVLRGRLGAAVATIEEALADSDGASVERGRLLLRLGEILRTRGEAADGAATLAEAIEVGTNLDDQRLVRTALGHQASCYVDMGELDAARECLAKLSDIERTDDLRQECELLKRTAYVQYYLGNYAEQRRQNEEALELAREIGDRRLEGLCLQGVGDSAFAMGDFDEAVQFYEKGLEIHRSFGNRHYEAMLLGNLGGAYHRDGQFMQARRCYSRSLELHRQTGARPYEGVVSFALGALEHETGNADDAHFHYDRALDIARATGQRSDEGALLLCKTWLDLESSRFAVESLRSRAREALGICRDSGDGWDAVALATVATIELLAGRSEDARAKIEEARELLPDSVVERAIVDAMVFLQEADAERGAGGFERADAPIYRTSLHARLALRLLSVAWRTAVSVTTGEELSEASDEPRLTVGPDTAWFQFPGGEQVDLRRRKALRLVLAHLLEQLRDAPGCGSDVYEVFERGWPGEEIHPDQAVERVYWAVRTLRKLGFEDTLVTTDEGYHLRADLVVRNST